MVGQSLNGGLVTGSKDYPLRGRVQRQEVRCYCGGKWEVLSPLRYEVVLIGVDEDAAQRNYERNVRRSQKPPESKASHVQVFRGGRRG